MLPPLDLDSRPASIASSGKVTDNTAPIVDDAPDVALIVAPSAAPSVAPSLKKHPRVSFLTEQTSHHPPVSAFFIDVPEKGITARGYDQVRTTGSVSGSFADYRVRFPPNLRERRVCLQPTGPWMQNLRSQSQGNAGHT